MKFRSKFILSFFLVFSLLFGAGGSEDYAAAESYRYYFEDGVDNTSLHVYVQDQGSTSEDFTVKYFWIDSGQSDVEDGMYWDERDFYHTSPNIRFEFYFFFDDLVAEKGDSLNLYFWFTLYSRDVGSAYYEELTENCWLEYMNYSGNWMIYSLGEVTGGDGSYDVNAKIDSAPCDISALRVVIEADVLELFEGGQFSNLREAGYSWVTMSSPIDIVVSGTRYDPFDNVVDVENEQVIIGNNIFETVQNILKYIWELPGKIANALGGFFDALGEFIVDGFEGFVDDVGQFFSDLSSDFESFIVGLQYDLNMGFHNLTTSILSGIEDLFIPDEDYFQDAYDTFAAEVPFVASIVDFVNFIWQTFSPVGNGVCPEPYVVEVEYRGEEMDVTILDLSWYEPFKPMVDLFLSAFIILGFAWSLFMHLPGIINGLNNDAVKGITEVARGDD